MTQRLCSDKMKHFLGQVMLSAAFLSIFSLSLFNLFWRAFEYSNKTEEFLSESEKQKQQKLLHLCTASLLLWQKKKQVAGKLRKIRKYCNESDIFNCSLCILTLLIIMKKVSLYYKYELSHKINKTCYWPYW